MVPNGNPNNKGDPEIVSSPGRRRSPGDPEILADAELVADAELMADAEIMADAELVADAEIMTDNDLMADDEIIAVPELMADAEIMADAELVADAEIMADTELVADAEIMTDTDLMADDEIIAVPELVADAEIMADAELMADGELFDDSGGVEDELLGLSVLAADAGKGVAEGELLIDLEFTPAELKVTEEPLIDLEMGVAELERVRFQSCLNKARYMETLEEKSLMDMGLAEENEDIMNPEICKLWDGSNLRISDNLDGLNRIRGDNSELGGLLGFDEFKMEMIPEIDAGISVFNNSNYVQGLIDCKKIINSRGYNILRVLLIKFLERVAITITDV